MAETPDERHRNSHLINTGGLSCHPARENGEWLDLLTIRCQVVN